MANALGCSKMLNSPCLFTASEILYTDNVARGGLAFI